MQRYRVPKKRVPVRISLRDQTERTASIFVGERAECHSGPEHPSDVMNSSDEFLVMEVAEGAVEFLRRGAVAFVSVPIQAEAEEGEAGDVSDVAIAIALDDGRRLEGRVRYRLPESARRLGDFLNLPDRFLRLERAGDVLLVNKHRIVSARMLDEGDGAIGPD